MCRKENSVVICGQEKQVDRSWTPCFFCNLQVTQPTVEDVQHALNRAVQLILDVSCSVKVWERPSLDQPVAEETDGPSLLWSLRGCLCARPSYSSSSYGMTKVVSSFVEQFPTIRSSGRASTSPLWSTKTYPSSLWF